MGKVKTEDGAEQGDGSPKKKKHKVVLKETIEESKAEPQGEAKAEAWAMEGKHHFKTELVRALWVHTTEMRLMCKAQERVATECTKISESVAYLVANLDLIVEGKRYM